MIVRPATGFNTNCGTYRVEHSLHIPGKANDELASTNLEERRFALSWRSNVRAGFVLYVLQNDPFRPDYGSNDVHRHFHADDHLFLPLLESGRRPFDHGSCFLHSTCRSFDQDPCLGITAAGRDNGRTCRVGYRLDVGT